MKYFLSLLCITPMLFAGSISNSAKDHIYEVNDTVIPFTLEDQHGKKHWIDNKTKKVFITYDKQSSSTVNRFITNKGGDRFLKDRNTLIIVDVSVIPLGIRDLFVLPSLEKFQFPLLLSFNQAFSRMFPYKDDHIAIMEIEKRIVKKIDYCNDEVCLEKIFKK